MLWDVDILERYPPPLELTADMLFALCTTPLAPLRRSFPGVPFLSLFGQAPLVLWFSRVHGLSFTEGGAQVDLGPAGGFGYRELNVVALCRSRSFFVPAIYASPGISPQLGHRYGMPKGETDMTFEASDSRVRSRAAVGGKTSTISAGLLSSGRLFGAVIRMALPVGTPPVVFPDGPDIRARITAAPRAQLAWVDGNLSIPVPWLETPRTLWRAGLYVPGFRMVLPAPGTSEPADWSEKRRK